MKHIFSIGLIFGLMIFVGCSSTTTTCSPTCASWQTCDTATKTCVAATCTSTATCGTGYTCQSGKCGVAPQLCTNKPVWFLADNGTGTTAGTGYVVQKSPFGTTSASPTTYANLDAECVKQATRLNPDYAAYAWKAIFLLPDVTGTKFSEEAVMRNNFFWSQADTAASRTAVDPTTCAAPVSIKTSSGALVTLGAQTDSNVIVFGQGAAGATTATIYDSGSNCGSGTLSTATANLVLVYANGLGFAGSFTCTNPFNMLCAAQF